MAKAQLGVSSGIEPGYYNDGSSTSEIEVGGMSLISDDVINYLLELSSMASIEKLSPF